MDNKNTDTWILKAKQSKKRKFKDPKIMPFILILFLHDPTSATYVFVQNVFAFKKRLVRERRKTTHNTNLTIYLIMYLYDRCVYRSLSALAMVMIICFPYLFYLSIFFFCCLLNKSVIFISHISHATTIQF